MRLTKKRKEFLAHQLGKNYVVGAVLNLETPDAEFVECYGVSKKFAAEAFKALVESLNA